MALTRSDAEILGETKEFVELDGYVTSGVDLEKLKFGTESKHGGHAP